MKIAIHKEYKSSITERWISYCNDKNIDYKLVNAYSNNIMSELNDCNVFMWHHHQSNYKDLIFAKQLLYSLELSGKKVFPNYYTTWHFDDKLGQKYLLEAIDAPFVPTHVFYTKKDATHWVNKVDFPKVFKLRGGAGAINVQLVNTRNEAVHLIQKAFSKGFKQYDWKAQYKEALRKYKSGTASLKDILRPYYYRIKRHSNELTKFRGNEKGYVYFQDFLPNNEFDIRVIVISNRAFAIKRMVRKDDFRASGSGNIKYERKEFDERCVEIAFMVNGKIKSQCIAYDFIYDEENNPLIIEISYGFAASVYDKCTGYWDEDMNWHKGSINPCGWIIEDLLKVN